MDNNTNNSIRLRHTGGWKAAIFIIVVEIGERVAFYGVSMNLITYLTNVLAQPVAVAARNVNLWIGVSALFPIIGGFLADSYLGRFRTIFISSLIYLIGLSLLTVATSKGRAGEVLFFISLYILSIGEGGHKPCIQTFAADQFDNETVEEKKTMSSFFNWWYLGIVIGAIFATLLVVYVQDNVSWTFGFGALVAAVAAALVVFLMGYSNYRKEVPVGSPLTSVMQVFVAAWRKRHLSYESIRIGGICKDGRLLAQTNQFRFLDKAAAKDETDESTKPTNPWRLCSINQIEQTKQVLRLLPIWLSGSIFFISISQLTTFFTKQASTMVRTIGPHFQIPSASIHVSTGFIILLAIPAYDRLFVPLARRITKLPSGITVLQRIGIGVFFSIMTMVIAALVEQKRVRVAKEFDLVNNRRSDDIVPMSVWWLLPPFMVCGLADVFSYVGFQELFYDEMPENMRSVGAAMFISMQGIGNLASSVVITLVRIVSRKSGEEWLVDDLNEAHLDRFYLVLAGIGVLNLCYFVWVSKGFHYKKFEEDNVVLRC